jgi:UDP-glucose 4-epimerase
MSPYGISKLAGENYVLSYGQLFGMHNTALRLFNVFGKGQSASSPYSGVITKFANALSSGHRPIIFGSGEQTRDFVHVDDVCKAFASAIGSGGFKAPLNIGSGNQTSVLGLLEEMCGISGKTPEIDFQPSREGDIMHSCADISEARKRLGFAPKMSLGDGLRELVEK